MGDKEARVTDEGISQDILKSLKQGERILWHEKTVINPFTPFMYLQSRGAILYLVLFLMFPFLFIFTLWRTIGDISRAVTNPISIFLIVMFIVPWCISIVYIIFLLKSTEYVLTNHRLIVMKGKFSKNLRSIDLEKITYVDVQIGIADRRLGTGCVHIGLPGPVTLQATYRGPERYSEKETLFGVKNPYEVQKLIKETIEQYKMEMKPPVAIIDTTLKREMPCPRCAAMLEIPPTSPNMGIRCPACAHVFKLNSS